jgi:hypothetical protein
MPIVQSRSPSLLMLLAVIALGGCSRTQPSLAPSAVPQANPSAPSEPSLVSFRDPATGFVTTDLRDAEEEVVRFNYAAELIWADGTRIAGFRVDSFPLGNEGVVSFIEGVKGDVCPAGCAFEVRFGTRDGERRGYLTLEYGHDNPGTVADLEVNGSLLSVTQSSEYPPGTPTLSGTVVERTSTGLTAVAGAKVYRGISTGWREATTDGNGFYEIRGLKDGKEKVGVWRDGRSTFDAEVVISGDTRFDIELGQP